MRKESVEKVTIGFMIHVMNSDLSQRAKELSWQTDLPGLVMGGGLVMVQFLGTVGFFSRDSIGFSASNSQN